MFLIYLPHGFNLSGDRCGTFEGAGPAHGLKVVKLSSQEGRHFLFTCLHPRVPKNYYAV